VDAVEAVCDADLSVLGSLLEKNLVRRTGERVWMLETIREFAFEQLDADPDADELRDRHAGHYLAFAVASERELRGPSQADAFAQLEAERDNLRTALERLLDCDPPAALELTAALWLFWFRRGYDHEGRDMLRAALERAGPEPTEARASALVGAAVLASDQGDSRETSALLREALACARAAGSTDMEIAALTNLTDDPDLDQAARIRLGEEAIALARANGNRWLLGLATGNQGSLLNTFGETERSNELTNEAYRLFRGVGDASMTGVYLAVLAWRAIEDGNPGEARAKLTESLELAQQIDDTRNLGTANVNLGWAALLEGDLDDARFHFREAAQIARRVGRRVLAAEALSGFAHAAAARGDPDRAARLAGAATTLGITTGTVAAPDRVTRPARAATTLGVTTGFDPTLIPFARHMDDARAALGEHAWDKAFAEGANLGFDAALSVALDT
jgi:tetratricopeptide (TPR) repeat protein